MPGARQSLKCLPRRRKKQGLRKAQPATAHDNKDTRKRVPREPWMTDAEHVRYRRLVLTLGNSIAGWRDSVATVYCIQELAKCCIWLSRMETTLFQPAEGSQDSRPPQTTLPVAAQLQAFLKAKEWVVKQLKELAVNMDATKPTPSAGIAETLYPLLKKIPNLDALTQRLTENLALTPDEQPDAADETDEDSLEER